MIKAVFFDLDGTLLDTSKDLGGALNTVLEQCGKPALPFDTIRPHVSNGANALIKLGFGEDLHPSTHQTYRLNLLDAYLADIASHTIAFAGIEALIEQCAANDIAWGIVTNKPAAYTDALMQHFEFASVPVAQISPDHVSRAKPDPEGLLKACEMANCKPSEALYVGDHERDIEAGRNANIATVAVGYGFTPTTKCHLAWGADYTVSSASEIWPIIARLNSLP